MRYLLLGVTLCTAMVTITAAMAQPAGRDPHESRAAMGPRMHDGPTVRVPSKARKHSVHTARRRAPQGDGGMMAERSGACPHPGWCRNSASSPRRPITGGRRSEGQRRFATVTCTRGR